MTNEEYTKQSTICTITMLSDQLEDPLPFMGLQRQSLENLEDLRDQLILEYNEKFATN
jgi:hypothetical protein